MFANVHSIFDLLKTYTIHRISLSTPSLLYPSSLTSCQVHRSSNGVEITSQTGKATVTYDPLQVELSVNGEIAVILNSRGLFNFEHYRKKR